jgi:type II secretory pathway component GspD/PulD (secretin)
MKWGGKTMMFNRWGLGLTGIVLTVFLTNTVWPYPLSDRILESEEAFVQGIMSASRDPFTPNEDPTGLPDIQSLTIQGLISHARRNGLVLLSGFMAWEGERIGKYKVEKISPGKVILQWGKDNQVVKVIPGYLKSRAKRSTQYSMDFRNAPLQHVISMISRLEDKNILAPPGLEGRVTASFDDVNPSQALTSILKVHGYMMAQEDGIIRVGQPDQFDKSFDMETTTIALHYGNAEKLQDTIKELLTEQGSTVADVRTNTLVVRDRPHVLASIRSLLKKMDYPDKKINIAAKILSVSESFMREMGVRWTASGTTGQTTIAGASNEQTADPFSGLLVGAVVSNNLDAALALAEDHGDVEIISRPNVTTLNNQEAKIRSGLKIFVKSNSDISLGSGGGSSASGSTSNLEEIESGITLTVTPQLTQGERMRLDIDVEESTADFSRTVDNIPAIVDNTASTSVLLGNGETTVIAGLMKSQWSKQRVGVPVLSKIPVLGLLFSRNSTTREKSELLIMITPRIVDTDTETAMVEDATASVDAVIDGNEE